MIEKEKLHDYAKKLMFEMNKEEYQTLQEEFEVMLKQIALIDKIDGIKDVKPMTFPFVTYKTKFREDVISDALETEEILANADSHYLDQVKVPKVVE